jgi:hypothetical protein
VDEARRSVNVRRCMPDETDAAANATPEHHLGVCRRRAT